MQSINQEFHIFSLNICISNLRQCQAVERFIGQTSYLLNKLFLVKNIKKLLEFLTDKKPQSVKTNYETKICLALKIFMDITSLDASFFLFSSSL